MRLLSGLVRRSKAATFVCGLLCVQLFNAQTPTPPAQSDQSDVLRVFTELVQTDVMVFNKQGRFVEGLKKEDFELRIDGKSKPIDFFEKITSGSVNEELQLASARGASRTNPARVSGPVPLDRGRPVYFYIDDFHLDLRGVATTQKLIRGFIEKQMGQNDELAISAASGQIGFLSQLTDNKTVLRAAVERLKYRGYSTRDAESPRMSEYQAILINNSDQDVLGYFIDYVINNNPGLSRAAAEQIVRARANSISKQASYLTTNTLAGLESLVRSVNKVPGRKVVIFISDGFHLDDRNSDVRERLRRITSASARNGVVIYAIDSRGLVTNSPDAAMESQIDPSGRLIRASMGEIGASQHGLNALASDTGGRAFFNSNAMEPAVKRAMDESAAYYLLAWKPEPQTGSSKFHRIEVRVTGRPDLTVHVRRGFFDLEPQPTADKGKKDEQQLPKANKLDAEYQRLIAAPYPERELPVSLRASFVNTPDKGDVLLTTTQIAAEFLSFKPVEGKHTAKVGILGGIYNDKGEAADRFAKQITMSSGSRENGETLIYGYPAHLKPGLYQVRVAIRDEDSGRGGSAHAWIEVPNLVSGQLALSSIFLGVRAQPTATNANVDAAGISATDLRVANRFTSNEFLRFMVFVYNATMDPVGSKPDVAIQIHIVRDGQPVVTSPLKKLSLEGIDDLKRIPYAAEVSLEGLRPGRYVMRISAVDRVAKTSASQQAQFDVE